jgi:hypothetical protein
MLLGKGHGFPLNSRFGQVNFDILARGISISSHASEFVRIRVAQNLNSCEFSYQREEAADAATGRQSFGIVL